MTQNHRGIRFTHSPRFKKRMTPLVSAMGVSALMFTSAGFAQNVGDKPAQEPEAVVLEKLEVKALTVDTNPYAQEGAPYKARISGDKRRVKPLADTPQTINVMTQTQLEDSGRSDLRDVLDSVPGITLGTGENGNAFGDRYIIRGFEARSDVFVDSLRDPGMTIRESFATEQVEVTKGPSSTFAGRGSTGGAVNSVTKQANPEFDFNKIKVGVGSDQYRRLSLDVNKTLTDDLAVRLNLLHAYRGIPERNPADKERNGAALSLVYEPNTDLTLTLDHYYLDANDKPDLGSYIEPNGGKPVDDIPVYLQDQDFLKSRVSATTFRLGYEINDSLTLRSAFRYGTTDNGYVLTGARGTNRAATDPDAPGAATIGISTHQGWQEISYFANQTNLYFDTELAEMNHQFVFGAEYTRSDVLNGTYDVQNQGATNCITGGRRGDSAGYCIVDASGAAVPNIGSLMGRSITRSDYDSDFSISTISLSAMDTVDLSDKLSVFAGVRLDRYDYTNTVIGRSGQSDYEFSDTLWNGHAGVVYKLNDVANVYTNFSTSTNINGGESDLGGNCGYGGLCGTPEQASNSKPEKTRNIEVGSKWNVMDKKLLLTAAVFQTTKSGVMENVGTDDYASLGTLNTGKNRVRGLELSMAGNVTKTLSAVAGVSFMKSEVLASNNADTVGRVLSNFADKSAFVQLRHQTTSKLALGGSITYSSALYTGQPDSAAGFNTTTGTYSYEVPEYAVLDLFAQYKYSKNLDFRINVGNVANKAYYLAGYRSGAFAYKGDSRNAYLTVSYAF